MYVRTYVRMYATTYAGENTAFSMDVKLGWLERCPYFRGYALGTYVELAGIFGGEGIINRVLLCIQHAHLVPELECIV